MICKARAGPKPIAHKKLTVENLRDAIKYCIGPEAKEAAGKMTQQIRNDVCFAFPVSTRRFVTISCVEWCREGRTKFLPASSASEYAL